MWMYILFYFFFCVYVFQLKCETLVFFNTMFFQLYFHFNLQFVIRFWQAGASFIWYAAVISLNTSLILSIIAFNVWFQRLMLVQTAEAFWINNSWLALNKLQHFILCISVSEDNCLQHYVWTSLFVYPLSHVHLGTIWKLFISFNVLYTFVLLMDMIAFLVFNNGELECHQCRCMYT